MDFGADLVYFGHSDEESVSEEEAEQGLMEAASKAAMAIDEDDGGSPLAALRSQVAAFPAGDAAAAPPPPAPMPPPVRPTAEPKMKKRVRWRRQDTNAVSVSLGTLATSVNMLTGDPISCKSCGAFVNAQSKLTPVVGAGAPAPAGPAAAGDAAPMDVEIPEGAGEDTKRWDCEFCGTPNIVELPPEEGPTSEALDYIIEPASAAVKEDAHNVVFCVDTSGSMCVTSEVQGRFNFRGADKRRAAEAEMRQFGDGSDQFMPGQSRHSTYVSRLQCVQAAVDTQLEVLEREFPLVTCGLVAFSSDVKIVGDGVQSEETVAGDKLSNLEACVGAGEAFRTERTVKETRPVLSRKVFELEENGATALGPALVAAVALAGSKPASKVVMCTDGLSNVGIGAIDNVKTDDDREAVTRFYEHIGDYAKSKGVSVSVVSIEGENCSVENLGRVADATGGQVEIVKPVDLAQNFSSILAERIIATGVKVIFMLHSGLRFREEGLSNRLERDIGNVTASTDVTFEYSVKTDAELAALPRPVAEGAQLPFQVQIHYTRPDGMKCVRVITQNKQITKDRAQAEQSVNVAVMATMNMQHTAKLIAKGEYGEARKAGHAAQRMFSRNVKSREQQEQYVAWVQKTEELDHYVRDQQTAERSRGLQLSDDEAADEDVMSKMAKKKKKEISRASSRDDRSARMVFNSKAISKSSFARK